MSEGKVWAEWFLFAVLIVDAVLLAILQLFFLPLRLDGGLLPFVAAAPFPLAIVVAAITTPLLVAQAAGCMGRVGSSPVLAAAPFGAWLLTLMLVALAGPGGDQVFVADWRSVALLAAGALPAAYVLGRTLGRVRAAATA